MRLPPNLAERLQNPSLHAQLMTAAEAAALIAVGTNVGMSGFTGAAYPHLLDEALSWHCRCVKTEQM